MQALKNRKAVIESALEHSKAGAGPVFIRFLSSYPEASIPDWVDRTRDEAGFVTVKTSMRFPSPPTTDDKGLKCRLKINGLFVDVSIPFDSMLSASQGGVAVIWDVTLPETAVQSPPNTEEPAKVPRLRPSWMHVIDGGSS